MRAGTWWVRLQIRRWLSALAARPLQRSLRLVLWWLPALFLPAILSFDAAAATRALSFVLSLDIPLTFVIAIGVTLDSSNAATAAEADRWLGPPAFRTLSLRWLMRLRWLLVARWPAGLALATWLLSRASTAPAAELYLISVLAMLTGGLFMWLREQGAAGVHPFADRPRRSRGMAALSWAPLHEAWDRLDARQLALLLVPVMLAAPMGALAGQVLAMMLVYAAAVFVVFVCQQGARVHRSMRRWLPAAAWSPLRIAYWTWRCVVLGAMAMAGAYLLWPAAAAPSVPPE